MIYEIKNSGFTAKIDSMGAQLVSLRGAGGFEYLWVGDPKYWREHAPILFPIVGALRENRAKLNGQWIEMAQHGFAKRSEFDLKEQGEGSIALTLRASGDTRAIYPFDFSLTVTYTLTEKGIDTRFTVENTGRAFLPYCIGGHPGFNLPIDGDAAFEDYTIQFEKDEDQSCPVIDTSARLIDWTRQGFRLAGKEIPLQHSLFYGDALVFDGLNSSKVRIVNKQSGKGVEMDFTGFPMLGIWSAANDGPYVCLEPWTGCATLTTEGDEFEEKKGMARLALGEKAEHSFSVRIL